MQLKLIRVQLQHYVNGNKENKWWRLFHGVSVTALVIKCNCLSARLCYIMWSHETFWGFFIFGIKLSICFYPSCVSLISHLLFPVVGIWGWGCIKLQVNHAQRVLDWFIYKGFSPLVRLWNSDIQEVWWNSQSAWLWTSQPLLSKFCISKYISILLGELFYLLNSIHSCIIPFMQYTPKNCVELDEIDGGQKSPLFSHR